MAGLTDYLTPAVLKATNVGVQWDTFPTDKASEGDKLAALQDICATVTSEMDTVANQTLRAIVDTEDEFGPDYTITVDNSSGWARFRFPSLTPILSIVSGRCSPAATNGTPTWTDIPTTAMATEHALVTPQGTTVPTTATGPVAVLIAPGYINWYSGRKGYRVQITAICGYPVAGIDQAASAGATSVHVDDVTGWLGVRGTIFDPPGREQITVSAVTPDVAGAISGPGTLTLATALKYDHSPQIGNPDLPDQPILLSAMPQALRQAGLYFAVHYGLIRGSTAAIMQSSRGQVLSQGIQSAQDWHALGIKEIGRWARSL